MKFKKFLEAVSNWKDIVNKFDSIESCIIEPDGLTIRTIGKKKGKFMDSYNTYSDKKIAKTVLSKIKSIM